MKVLIKELRAKPEERARLRKAAEAILEDLGLKNGELSILLADNRTLRELNRRYRNLDRPTDVLSFPMDDPALLGDVAISLDKVRSQASEYGVTEEEELLRLLVHGVLHLAGYDHVRGGRQAKKMKEKEEELLGMLRKRGFMETSGQRGD